MTSIWLLPVLLLSGAAMSSHSHSGLSCVNDYMTNITCEWHNATAPVDHNCLVRATRNTWKGFVHSCCKLKPLSSQPNAIRGCSFLAGSTDFSFAEKLDLNVICNGTLDLCDGVPVVTLRDYKPGHHVKMQPLSGLSIIRGNFTWNKPVPNTIEEYEFNLHLKMEKQSWTDVEPVWVGGTFALLNDRLKMGQVYQARVRVKPEDHVDEGRIKGQWSEWSPAVSWRSDVGQKEQITPKEGTLTPVLLGFVVPTLLMPLILLIICKLHKHCCKHVSGREHVPDPSKYFKPLLSVHNGNFQKWLVPQHSTHSFLAPHLCDCDISPVEVSEPSEDAQFTLQTQIFQSIQAPLSQQSSANTHSSSGFSNMGYFYTENQPGSLCLETCPVYFTYQPEGVSRDAGGSDHLQSSKSYERLQCQVQDQGSQSGEPLSPDSGFGMEVEEAEISKREGEDVDVVKEEYSGVNIQHLVSFVLSLQDNSRMPTKVANAPVRLQQLPRLFVPWPEDTECPGEVSIDADVESPADGTVRPSSLVVQPCSSGYLTLKEMQKYSNKSI